jgi:hypothetical protein
MVVEATAVTPRTAVAALVGAVRVIVYLAQEVVTEALSGVAEDRNTPYRS